MRFFYRSGVIAVEGTAEAEKVELGFQPLLYFVSQPRYLWFERGRYKAVIRNAS
jgi:hypothetical protein